MGQFSMEIWRLPGSVLGGNQHDHVLELRGNLWLSNGRFKLFEGYFCDTHVSLEIDLPRLYQ